MFADGREPSAPAAVENTSFSAPLLQIVFSHVCVNCGGKDLTSVVICMGVNWGLGSSSAENTRPKSGKM